MNKAEVAELLTLIAAFDRRTIGDADVEAWHLVLGDLDAVDCADAIREHFTESREWLMPADVRTRAVNAKRRREGRARRAALEAQIAAENPQGELTQRPVAALLAGQPIGDDETVRAERRRMLRKAAHTKRVAIETDTAQRAEHQARLAQARAELDAVRGESA